MDDPCQNSICRHSSGCVTTKFQNGFYLYYITGPEGFPPAGTAQDFEDEWAEVSFAPSLDSKVWNEL